MTYQSFKNPILGIFVQNSGLATEHCFGALFERAKDGHITDYRLISYTGTPAAPNTSLTDEVSLTNGGILLPISKTAAKHLVAQLDAVHNELTAEPKVQRYYYSQRVKLANSLQAKKGRIPTNCVDYLMQAAQKAWIDVGSISETLRDADAVGDISDVIDKATPDNISHCRYIDAMMSGTTPMHYAMISIGQGTQAVCFRNDQGADMLDAMNALPHVMLTEASQSKPLGQPTSVIERPLTAKTLAARTVLANAPKF